MKKLEIEQAEKVRKKFLSDWEIRKGTYLYKKIALDDYNQALRFMMSLEKAQVELDHFADFMNFYNELTILITTHDVNGLTELDFELALYVEEAIRKMGARQIDESLSEKWSDKYKRSINCSNPKGFSQKAHCAGRKKNEDIDENFADGKKKGKSRPGRVKRSGASCKGSVTSLRKRAKNSSGERAKMYHWCANMKSGRKKS